MKKKLRALLSVMLAVFMVVSLAAVPASAAGINKSSITLTKGYQTTLKFSGSSSVTWSTGDKSIATVTSKGKVAGKAPGTTYIYAKSGGNTYKCKVNVVPSKITASKSSVDIDERGQTATVTMTVKGSHNNLSVSSTDKSVATATWVKPWNGDKIGLKITAKSEGSCRIKVYSKNYSSTCYKYIDVNVGSSLFDDNDDDIIITPNPKTLDVEPGKTGNININCSNLNQLACASYDSNIATVTAANTSGTHRNFTVTGVSVGRTVIRFYDKSNVKNYVDVTVNVGGSIQYYEFYTTKPASTPVSTDQIKTVQAGNVTYYVIVPANYDPANLNSRAGDKFGYQYYMVYDKMPSRVNSGDTYREFTHTNTSYAYGKRYVLLPAKFDEVRYNTAIAVYNNQFDYYKVYSEKPSVKSSWDGVDEWIVKDASGKDVKRYVLFSWTDNDYQAKLDALKEADKAANNVYSQYLVYDKIPAYNKQNEDLIAFTKNGAMRYIVVPKTGVDVVKRNDLIRKETGVVRPYVIYSESITANTANGEVVSQMYLNGKNVYILTRPADTNHDSNMLNIYTNFPTGT